MPVVVKDFEVVQETSPPAAPVASPAAASGAQPDAGALERELAVLRARAQRVRAY
jgi:hypothetical protein